MAVDLDNDNGPGNEFDFDFTIGFQGKGFDYTDQVHKVNNLRGMPEADKFFMDPRYRQLTEFLYPDHKSAKEMIFKRGEWSRVNLYMTKTMIADVGSEQNFMIRQIRSKSAGKMAVFDNNKQSDAAGDRGEWDIGLIRER